MWRRNRMIERGSFRKLLKERGKKEGKKVENITNKERDVDFLLDACWLR